jgi:DNA adenine methylase
VSVFNKDALKVIDAYNDRNCLVYCDPPYLHETRHSKKAYELEMTTEDHHQLAQRLLSFRGKVVLSGYPSKQYDEWFGGWRVVKKSIANHASQKKAKQRKVEALWCNF